jgi:hypothetical protein
MGERWNQKLAAFRAQLVARMRPIKVEPKHTIRHSGPRLMPSDWWTEKGQLDVHLQCNLCHERTLPGMPPLIRGLCGPCRISLEEKPEAA